MAISQLGLRAVPCIAACEHHLIFDKNRYMSAAAS